MDWIEKTKEKLLEHLVAGVLALVVLLFSIIWLAVPSSAWDKILAVIPKSALLAVIVLELIAIVGLLAALVAYKRRVKKEKGIILCWGMYWDKSFNPHCPSDKTPLSFKAHALESGKQGTILHCLSCGNEIVIWDSVQGALTLSEAKQQLRSRMRKK